MRAKFVNEIKRDIEGSGLGPIGVGDATLDIGYKYMLKLWPGIDEHIHPLKQFKSVSVNGIMIGGDKDPTNIKLNKSERAQISKITGFKEEELCYVDGILNSRWDVVAIDALLRKYSIEFNELERGGSSKIDNWEFEWVAGAQLGYLELGDAEYIIIVLKNPY
jgi:hypothetical protein